MVFHNNAADGGVGLILHDQASAEAFAFSACLSSEGFQPSITQITMGSSGIRRRHPRNRCSMASLASSDSLASKKGRLSNSARAVRLTLEPTSLMQFLMLIHLDEPRWAEFLANDPTASAMSHELWSWYEERARSGKILTAGRLRESSTATTVRRAKGRPVITDGPFAETKEVLGGFEIVECKDLDEAMAITKTFPALSAGLALEVRPLVPMEELRPR